MAGIVAVAGLLGKRAAPGIIKNVGGFIGGLFGGKSFRGRWVGKGSQKEITREQMVDVAVKVLADLRRSQHASRNAGFISNYEATLREANRLAIRKRKKIKNSKYNKDVEREFSKLFTLTQQANDLLIITDAVNEKQKTSLSNSAASIRDDLNFTGQSSPSSVKTPSGLNVNLSDEPIKAGSGFNIGLIALAGVAVLALLSGKIKLG